MKYQSLSISIPEPCHENWSEMTPVEQGRHCQSCQKTVVDFTRMPKYKIAEFISQTDTKLCGRFTNDQLDINLITPRPSYSWMKYAAILLGLAPVMAYGQETSKTIDPPISAQKSYKGEISIENFEKNQYQANNQRISRLIKGMVVDHDSGEAILFGTVAVYLEDKLVAGVETDLDGKFSIEVPEGATLEASYIGYESYEMSYTEISQNADRLVIKLKKGVISGEMVVVGLYVPDHIEVQKIEEISDSVMLPTIEITDYRNHIETNCNTFSCYTGITAITAEERESWLKRQWRKFKNLLVGSYEEAERNQLEIIQSKEIENLPIENIPAEAKNINKIEQDRLDIMLFPNPTSGVVNLTIPDHISNFKLNISNMKNELVYSKTFVNNPNALDLSTLVSGPYIISIIHQDKLIYSEMVIKI